MKILETTLLLLRKDNEILLAKKKRGFGEGKYNGVGGKLEEGETPEEAMIRETEEEIMITPTKYEKMGVIEFLEYVKGERANVKFHLYVATEWKGNPKESEEMIPKWFSLDNLPYNEMFPDDKYWLPYILKGKKVNAFFDFDEEWNLLSHHIEEL
ncbi:MAG: 8-oxo-dGTP diphosphatase [Bacilli bacterium]|nr:8-oxo-dGTP diphosphatase [Bacilli bacterium]